MIQLTFKLFFNTRVYIRFIENPFCFIISFPNIFFDS